MSNFFINQITVYHFQRAITVDIINRAAVATVDELTLEEIKEKIANNDFILRETFENVYFRHNKKSNLIDKRNRKRFYWLDNYTYYKLH